jgi:hypothetical protein
VGMNAFKTRAARLGLAAAALAAVLAMTGCGSIIREALAEDNSAPAVTAAPAAEGQYGADSGGNTGVKVEIGECVKLGGTTEKPTISKAVCGSFEANYKVIGKERTSDACVADSDMSYYTTKGARETGALCLDVDWNVGDCFDMSGEDPRRITCTTSATEPVKVIKIISGSSDVNSCPDIAEEGWEYPTRNFVVCVADPTATA